MRYLLLVLLLAGAGVGAYYLATGRLPMVALSEDEQKVAKVRETFDTVRTQIRQANRAAAVSGMDTSGMGDDPATRIDQVQRELKSMIGGLKSQEAKDGALKLQAEIDAFRRELK